MIKIAQPNKPLLRAGSLILSALWMFVALGSLHLCLCGSCHAEQPQHLQMQASVEGSCCGSSETHSSEGPGCELLSACTDCVELDLVQLPATQLSPRLTEAPPSLLNLQLILEDLFQSPTQDPALSRLLQLQQQRPPGSLFPQEQIHILRI